VKVLLVWLLTVNAAGYALMGADKARAQRGARRIRERTLLLTAAAGGSVGVLLGMRRFRHKTKHRKFTVGVPAILLVQIGVVLAVILLIK